MENRNFRILLLFLVSCILLAPSGYALTPTRLEAPVPVRIKGGNLLEIGSYAKEIKEGFLLEGAAPHLSAFHVDNVYLLDVDSDRVATAVSIVQAWQRVRHHRVAREVVEQVSVYVGEVLMRIPEKMRFDVVNWNQLFVDFGKDRDFSQIVLKYYLREAKKLVTSDGAIYFHYASVNGAVAYVSSLANKFGWEADLLEQEPQDKGQIVEFYRLRRINWKTEL